MAMKHAFLMAFALSACGRSSLLDFDQGSDLASARDLAAPPDLARLRDFARPDLTRPDLTPPDDCPPEARLVYVVDGVTAMLSSFRPDTRSFKDVAILTCPANPDLTPFSLAVQRDGTAWVTYASYSGGPAQLFRVDVETGACDPSAHVPGAGAPTAFGETIVLEGAVEKLFLLGDTDPNSSASALGTLDLSSFAFNSVGFVDGEGDLTSDSAGHLYAFLPDWFGADARVEELDPSSGAALRTFTLASMDSFSGDCAVAAWGGSLWLFAGNGTTGPSAVFELDPKTGALSTAIADTGRHVVGAGSAPCRAQ